MFSSAQQSDSYGISLFFKIFLVMMGVAGLIYASSFVIDKMNDDKVIRVMAENKRLTKNNQILAETNKKLNQQTLDYKRRLDAIDNAMEGYKQQLASQ